jgi:hypothetical protein
VMTEKQGRQLLILAARADHLAHLRHTSRISEEEYIDRLNDLRRIMGYDPLQVRKPKRRELNHPHAVGNGCESPL